MQRIVDLELLRLVDDLGQLALELRRALFAVAARLLLVLPLVLLLERLVPAHATSASTRQGRLVLLLLLRLHQPHAQPLRHLGEVVVEEVESADRRRDTKVDHQEVERVLGGGCHVSVEVLRRRRWRDEIRLERHRPHHAREVAEDGDDRDHNHRDVHAHALVHEQGERVAEDDTHLKVARGQRGTRVGDSSQERRLRRRVRHPLLSAELPIHQPHQHCKELQDLWLVVNGRWPAPPLTHEAFRRWPMRHDARRPFDPRRLTLSGIAVESALLCVRRAVLLVCARVRRRRVRPAAAHQRHCRADERSTSRARCVDAGEPGDGGLQIYICGIFCNGRQPMRLAVAV